MSKLTQEQIDLLTGSLLGDGNLQTENGSIWRYRALHSTDQLGYLTKKYEILAPLCGTGIINASVFDERTQRTYKRCYFNTRTQGFWQPPFQKFGTMFYTYDATKQKYVKDVPLNIEEYLTPRALAFFYMDDGSVKDRKNSSAMRICTEGFSKPGVERLSLAIKTRYNIKTTLSPVYVPRTPAGIFLRPFWSRSSY